MEETSNDAKLMAQRSLVLDFEGGVTKMWARELARLRDRYSKHRLPMPLHYMARVCWKTVAKPVLSMSLRSLSRRQSFVPPSNWEWKKNLVLGLHEEETVELCARLIEPGMTVFDIGAHVGYFTRLLAKLVGPSGRVYGFEPNPNTFSVLRENTKQLSNVVLINKAVSIRSGLSRLFLEEIEVKDSLFQHADSLPAIDVELISLDQFWNEIGRPHVHFVKMDIEGAEPDVLKGATEFLSYQRHLSLVTEFSPSCLRAAGTEPEEFLNLLSGLEFTYAAIGPRGKLLVDLPKIDGKYVNLFCQKSHLEGYPFTR